MQDCTKLTVGVLLAIFIIVFSGYEMLKWERKMIPLISFQFLPFFFELWMAHHARQCGTYCRRDRKEVQYVALWKHRWRSWCAVWHFGHTNGGILSFLSFQFYALVQTFHCFGPDFCAVYCSLQGAKEEKFPTGVWATHIESKRSLSKGNGHPIENDGRTWVKG